MSKSYDDYEGRLAAAVRAAIARINGKWDDPDLEAFGPLSCDTLADVKAILQRVEGDT